MADLEAAEAYARGRDLADAGRWLEATKHLYVALLLRLAELGLVVFSETKTNADYVREVSARRVAGGLLRRGTEIFEPVAYGGAVASASECRELDRIYHRLDHE